MQVIVDYNNIPQATRRLGVKYVAESIARCLGAVPVGKYRRLNLRLYDGWYQVQSPTQLAQRIAVEVQKDFPTVVSLTNPTGGIVKAVVAAEMAYSLHCDPNIHLWHTFRPRSGQANLSCKSPVTSGCVSASCVLSTLPGFFTSQRCPDASCTLTTEDLIVRNEQKLVDSMMATDLISLHLSNNEELVVVSSDDDLWPSLRLLLQRGHTVYHVHTKPNHSTPSFYTSRISANQYIQLNL